MIIAGDFHEGLERHADVTDLVLPPYIEVWGDYLIWGWGLYGKPLERVKAGAKMLEQFVRLSDAPSQSILDFASQWGPLEICEHDLPASHQPHRVTRESHCGARYLPSLDRKFQHGEPLSTWRRFSRHARAVLRVAARLHERKLAHPKDWEVVYEGSPDPPWRPQTVARDRRLLVGIVDDWLEIGDVRPQVTWTDRPKVELALGATRGHVTAGTFGGLAVQLMLAIVPSMGVATCSDCGQPYVPKRAPPAGRLNFCEECGRQGAMRAASRKYRRKKPKQHGGLKREGNDVEEGK